MQELKNRTLYEEITKKYDEIIDLLGEIKDNHNIDNEQNELSIE